jgi:hypothetical protein
MQRKLKDITKEYKNESRLLRQCKVIIKGIKMAHKNLEKEDFDEIRSINSSII